jgi:hypothetical protein
VENAAIEGRPDLLTHDMFAPVGMDDAGTAAQSAILRSGAIGHFPDLATGGARRTDLLVLLDTGAPARATPISSNYATCPRSDGPISPGGLSRSGQRVLSHESIAGIQSGSHDMRRLNVSPLGLGLQLHVMLGERCWDA